MMRNLACLFLLGILSACGGDGSQPPDAGPAGTMTLPVHPLPPSAPDISARVLEYKNPASEGFRLEVEPSTNRTGRLLLHLVLPRGQRILGVALRLRGEPAAVWVAPDAGKALFRCGRGWDPGASEPRLARARVRGECLEVGLFQRDRPAVLLEGWPVMTLALELRPGTGPGVLPLRIDGPGGAVYLDADRQLREMELRIGELKVE